MKQTINDLLKWMLPHIPYMKRYNVKNNIEQCIYFYYNSMDRYIPKHTHDMLKYLRYRYKNDTDIEFLSYCYNLMLWTEGMSENVI